MNTDNILQSMRILITRPADRADALLHAISASGGSAVHIPLLAVTALDEQHDQAICAATTRCLQQLDSYQRVIAISMNAVHFGMTRINSLWSTLPPHIIWYGIGAATIDALRAYDVVVHDSDNAGVDRTMTSEALLAINSLQNLKGERILILRGVGGREQLASVLRERGAAVDYAECYRRVEPVLDNAQHSQLQMMQFDVISVNSTETLENLWRMLAAPARVQACQRALVVPSERVANAARALGFKRVVSAANAGTAATLAAIKSIGKN